MALNKNHEFEEVNGVKCGIVEKNVKPDRVGFLKELLELNGYTVITAPTPPPKVAAAPSKPAAAPSNSPGGGEQAAPSNSTGGGEQVAQTIPAPPPPPPPPPPPETFTVGVTDTTFNPINAIFGRMLKTRTGNIVTLAYWNQEETESHDEVPYYEK